MGNGLKGDRDAGLTRVAGQCDLTTVRVDDGSDDREPQTGAALSSIAWLTSPDEPLEHQWLQRFWDSGSVV